MSERVSLLAKKKEKVNHQNNTLSMDFPSVFGTSSSNAGGSSLIPDLGTKILTCLLAKEPEHKTETVF